MAIKPTIIAIFMMFFIKLRKNNMTKIIAAIIKNNKIPIPVNRNAPNISNDISAPIIIDFNILFILN